MTTEVIDILLSRITACNNTDDYYKQGFYDNFTFYLYGNNSLFDNIISDFKYSPTEYLTSRWSINPNNPAIKTVLRDMYFDKDDERFTIRIFETKKSVDE